MRVQEKQVQQRLVMVVLLEKLCVCVCVCLCVCVCVCVHVCACVGVWYICEYIFTKNMSKKGARIYTVYVYA